MSKNSQFLSSLRSLSTGRSSFRSTSGRSMRGRAPLPQLTLQSPLDESASTNSEIPRGLFSNHVDKAISRIAPDRTIAGIYKPTISPMVKQIIGSNFLSKKQEADILAAIAEFEQIPKEKAEIGFYGSVVTQRDRTTVEKVDPKKILESEVVLIPGLGGAASQKRIVAHVLTLEKMLPEARSVFYVPEGEFAENVAERYAKGVMPYINSHYINENESANFFEKVLKQKFFDEEGKLLPAEECKRLVIVSHSIGAREAGSHIRYFKKYLEEECNLIPADIEPYMNKILRFNVGSPLTSGTETTLSPSINIVSLSDTGSKKPQEFIEKTYANAAFYKKPVTFSTVTGGYAKKALVVVQPGIVESSDKDPFGHSAYSYIEAISKRPEFTELLQAVKKFANHDISDEEAIGELKAVFRDAERYPLKNPDMESGVAKYVETMTGRVLEMLNMQYASSVQTKHDICSTSSVSIEPREKTTTGWVRKVGSETRGPSNEGGRQ